MERTTGFEPATLTLATWWRALVGRDLARLRRSQKPRFAAQRFPSAGCHVVGPQRSPIASPNVAALWPELDDRDWLAHRWATAGDAQAIADELGCPDA